jgi:hypothetical protein
MHTLSDINVVTNFKSKSCSKIQVSEFYNKETKFLSKGDM